ncbi:MAG TPA: hypothetical protein VFZ11_15165 [Gemmatimonadaceae bacterium]
MLRLLADPSATSRAPRARCLAPRAAARRARVFGERSARLARCEAPARGPGPSSDDAAVRRRELVELGRLALAYEMREALAR